MRGNLIRTRRVAARPRPWLGWAAAVFVSLIWCPAQNSTAGRPQNLDRPKNARAIDFRNAAPGVGYVGSKVCAECHADIYNDYVKTDMGRSMSLASDPAQLATVPHPIHIFDQRLNRHFEVLRREGSLFQSEYAQGADGKEIFRENYKLEYVVGSGANGASYIVRRDSYLFEAPLSYYSRTNAWGLSPGYEYGDYGFSRPIAAECIACHSGRPQPVSRREGLYKDPPFRELAIGCENCHGPGQLHVKERQEGAPLAGDVDTSIVNPAKLAPWLADNVCMNCHQGSDARVLQPGKEALDFRPGTPLDDTVAILSVPYSRESPPEDPLLQHYASMILSRCYRESGRRLACITCHDPHRQPAPVEAPTHFRAKCLGCHREESCPVPLKVRMKKIPPDDCIGCHMPKQKLKVISHSALTNHRIIAYQEELFPEAAFHLTGDLPDLIHFDAVPGEPKPQVPPLTLLQAYSQLMASHPVYRARYNKLLDQLAQAEPENVLVLSAGARKKLETGTPAAASEALHDLGRAVELGSTAPSDYELLADLLARTGRDSEAIDVLQRGLALAPFSSRLYKALALRYIKLRRFPDALEVMRKELELFPEDSFMRMLLEKAGRGAPSSR